MSSSQKYLLIFDSVPVDPKLTQYFSKFDYQVVHQHDLSQLDRLIKDSSALLINWTLIQGNPENIAQLYRLYPGPLFVISDHIDDNICVQMLEAGADDFLVKPIHPRELHARISAISRRVLRSKHDKETKDVLLFANWRLYPSSRQIFDQSTGQELVLSAGEYELLLAFIQQPQCVLDREFLLQFTKHSDLAPFDRRIDVQISRLRQKIETDAKKPVLIKTIRNEGYLFTSTVQTLKEHLKEG